MEISCLHGIPFYFDGNDPIKGQRTKAGIKILLEYAGLFCTEDKRTVRLNYIASNSLSILLGLNILSILHVNNTNTYYIIIWHRCPIKSNVDGKDFSSDWFGNKMNFVWINRKGMNKFLTWFDLSGYTKSSFSVQP